MSGDVSDQVDGLLDFDFDDSYQGDRKDCECCGSTVEYRHGTALHHTCIECSEAGCNKFESKCGRSKQATLDDSFVAATGGGETLSHSTTETDQ